MTHAMGVSTVLTVWACTAILVGASGIALALARPSTRQAGLMGLAFVFSAAMWLLSNGLEISIWFGPVGNLPFPLGLWPISSLLSAVTTSVLFWMAGWGRTT